LKTEDLTEIFYRNFPFHPTADQDRAIYILSRFLLTEKNRACFLLKGYAGTGKTSLMKALGKTARAARAKVFQMSPTGRAAKVLQTYTSRQALTIHKSIYFRQINRDGSTVFVQHDLTKSEQIERRVMPPPARFDCLTQEEPHWQRDCWTTIYQFNLSV